MAVAIALGLRASHADVGVSVGNSTQLRSVVGKDASAISPTLRPESDKKFFGKDYPADARPKVDVLHFKHPYPVVQDSGDFDRDYVKDENSDNGEWKAQTEYDRLRHKLLKEKEDLAKALENKKKAEDELHDAMKREKEHEDKVKKEKEDEAKGDAKKKKEHVEHDKVHEAKTPGGASSDGEVKIAAEETKKAMKKLEDCKKELAEARERLKKLMKELEEAKKKQEETQAALDAAKDKLDPAEDKHKELLENVEEEHKEYLEAKANYETAEEKLAKMEADLKVAEGKVKAMRDAEDNGKGPDGGVYNSEKSSTGTSSVSLALLLLAVLMLR